MCTNDTAIQLMLITISNLKCKPPPFLTENPVDISTGRIREWMRHNMNKGKDELKDLR